MSVRWIAVAAIVLLCIAHPCESAEEETLPPLKDGRAPETVDEIWAGYDPQIEPLEATILKEWEDDGIVCRIVRYRIGIFKGAKSVMAGIFAFPRGGKNLPGLIQVHGGGQSANLNAATTNARRGYACISLNWGGNPLNDGNYQKIWNDPGTDWGAVDGTHPPKKDPVNHFVSCAPNDFTIDAVDSPRNSAWMLVTLGVRRGLTFLQQQPEVDGAKLGVYGHSMGGKLTVMTAAIDDRVKAAVPSCGGISDHPTEAKMQSSMYHQRLTCPVMFLNPVNDFHGKIDDLARTVATMPGKSYRFSCAANLDHRDRPEHFVCGPLWFDEHLKGTFAVPRAPQVDLQLKTARAVPILNITPDASRPVQSVDVYYTQQARSDKVANPCWRHAKASRTGPAWAAELPLFWNDRPVRVYANVNYALDAPITGAGYYYSLYTTPDFTVSSPLLTTTVDTLSAAGVEATDQTSREIESFEPGWQKGWYVFNENGTWPYRTNKIQDPKWQGPSGARLVLEVQSEQPNKLVLEIDRYAVESDLPGGNVWQTISLECTDFRNAAGEGLSEWATARELVIADRVTLKNDDMVKVVGRSWQGPLPKFRRLRWADK
ncbi:MAG: acetylxylan esterase [Planctomycetia bacterium]|nr:acetylxylan esterase [Planctomycetia bacterium]